MNNHPLQKYISELNIKIEDLKNEIKQVENHKLEYYKIMMNDIFNNDFDNIIKNKYTVCLINDFKYNINKNKQQIKFDVSGITIDTTDCDELCILEYICIIYDDSEYNIKYFKDCYLSPYSDKYMNQECYILHRIRERYYFIIDKVQYDKMLNEINQC